MLQNREARLIWTMTGGHRLLYSSAIMAMAIGYIFMYAVPLVAKYSIDAVLSDGELEQQSWLADFARLLSAGEPVSIIHYLLVGLICMVLTTAVAGFCLYLRGLAAAMASEGIIRNLRSLVFHHLEHLPVRYHDQADTGDLVQRCTSDVETIRVFLAAQIIEISRAILLLISVLPILYYLDVGMMWLSLATMPLLLVFAIWFFRRVKELFLAVDESEAELTTVLQENLTGIRVVRAFAQQEFESEKFAIRNAQFRDKNMRLMKLLAIYFSVSDFICLTQLGALLIVGAHWVQAGSLSVGTLFAFLTYEAMVIWPIRHLGRVLTDAGKAVVSIGRILQVLLEPEESQHEEHPEVPLKGAIYMSGVSFAYDQESAGSKAAPAVLHDISMHVRPGESLAIMGPPGSGKSTLVRLLLRLYEYRQGTIQLDGRELSELNRKFVRSQISIVLQEPFLYSASIGDNLRVGKMSANDAELLAATEAACIHESISTFDRGYDSMVGERGVTLSGGQRQRLALARALLKDPPILILDDALSAVDTDTESRILAALRQRKGRSTTIIIAHRLSTVMAADKIILLDQGKIIQSGTHRSLLNEPGMYRRLCAIQGDLDLEIDRQLKSGDGAQIIAAQKESADV